MTNSTWLITGGAGSFGKAFTKFIFAHFNPKAVRIYSRDEFKHAQMYEEFEGVNDRLRFLIGDVRDADRLKLAVRGCDYVVHAAALKRVPDCEYNPFEAVNTNILGTQFVIQSVLNEPSVKKCVLISTDKAVDPVNLYGVTKSAAERLWIQANVFSTRQPLPPVSHDDLITSRKYPTPVFSIVRYGNVVGSRGSVIPLFKQQAKKGVITITDKRMSRFWITMDQACRLVSSAFNYARPGEIFVPKIKAAYVLDIAKAIAPKAKTKYIGIRPGEKDDETLINEHEAKRTESALTNPDYGYYIIHPETLGPSPKFEQARFVWSYGLVGLKKPEHIYVTTYNSMSCEKLTVKQIRELVK